MTRFLILSDAQIGAHPDYGRHPGDRLKDQAATLAVIAELAREHKVDAVLNGGDTFEGPTITPVQQEVFADFVAQCREYGIPVLTILGNGRHDLAMQEASALAIFQHIDGVEVFTEPGIRRVGDTTVCMLPWVSMSKLRARMNGGDGDEINALASALLIEIARELREQCDGSAILLGHWHVDSATTVGGKGASEIFREPLLNVAALDELGFDAVLLGHNHLVQTLAPNIVHIGSPQPIDFGESLSEHGVWIYDSDPHSTLTYSDPISPLTFVPIESRPFVTLDLAVDDALGYSLDSDEDVTDAVVRVRYTATEEQARRVNHAEITKALYDAGAHRVFAIQPTILRENRARVEVDEDITPLAAVEAWAHANELSGEQHQALADLTTTYLQEAGV